MWSHTDSGVHSCHSSVPLASKSVSDAKSVNPMVKQPVFLRSMSAPSDLEMIANQDVEFTHAPQRFLSCSHEQAMRRGSGTDISVSAVTLAEGDTTLQATAAAPSPCCSLWPSRTVGTNQPTASCWGSSLPLLEPLPIRLYINYCVASYMLPVSSNPEVTENNW